MSDEEYINALIDHIHNMEARIDALEHENAELHRQNKSYKMWMDRSIQRVKAMQN